MTNGAIETDSSLSATFIEMVKAGEGVYPIRDRKKNDGRKVVARVYLKKRRPRLKLDRLK